MDRIIRAPRGASLAALLVIAIVGVPGPVAGGTPDASAWSPVEAGPIAAQVGLTATDLDAAGVGTTSAFELTSLDGTPVTELLDGLSVDPPASLSAEVGARGDSLTLRPSGPLQAGTAYRFTSRSATGALLGSWVFRTRTPLHVVGTLPRDEAGRVPVDSGIEITFDQEGATDAERQFTIDPAVNGRFEMHGDTLAFVPDGLEHDTVYAVTLRAGVGVAGSDVRLEDDVRFEFKTAREGPRPRPQARFARLVAEASTADAPVFEVDYYGRQSTLPLEIYRIGSLEAAIEAVRDALSGSRWAEEPAIDTSGLHLVSSHELEVRGTGDRGGGPRLELAGPLPAGWYVVVLPSDRGDAQSVLQVSDLAAFAQASSTKSLVWVNDPISGDAVADAEIGLPSGASLGLTDADGLAVFETPTRMLGADPVVLVVRTADRAVLVPFGAGGWRSEDIMPCWECRTQAATDPDAWWQLLYTDRLIYRPDDRIGAWGMLRQRESGAVPESAELRLVSYDDFDGPSMPIPIATAEVVPAPSGSYAVELPVHALPYGAYQLELWADDTLVSETDIEVDRIVKPAYGLDLSTDTQVTIAGDPITTTAQATFFDGTAVPALPLTIESDRSSAGGVTDAFGSSTQRVEASAGRGRGGQWSWQWIGARPARGEEADISDWTSVLVFRSSIVLGGKATIADGRATLRGSVHDVALERLRSGDPPIEGERFDPRARPVGGIAVSAAVTEHIPVRREVGTVYDFIAKKVVPVYDYSERRVPLGTHDLVSGPDGAFELSFPVDAEHGYTVELAASDASDRTTRMRVYAQELTSPEWGTSIYVAPPGVGPFERWFSDELPTYRIGDSVKVDFQMGESPQPTGGDSRYLFMLGQRGLRRWVLQDAPQLSTPFLEDDVPSLTISGVRWTGSTYLADAWGFTARLGPDAQRIDVELSVDQERYEPGEKVAVEVLTKGADGEPLSADVVVRAVDEKLFAIGAASDVDPLTDLYEQLSPGWLASYASHQVPLDRNLGGFGDQGAAGGGGGGPREDFRDALLFRTVTTGADGRATVDFGLSDDLTSWRIGASALTPDLQAGEGLLLVPVGLPFFLEAVVAPEYLRDDLVSIRLRSYGTALAAGDRVTFEVASDTLGSAPVVAEAPAFGEIVVPLPPLALGRHEMTLSGSAESGGTTLSDALVRTFDVVESHLEQGRLEVMGLDDTLTPPGGPGLTSIVVSDAGRGRFLGPLSELVDAAGPRADQAIAAAEARRLLVEHFGVDPHTLPDPTVQPSMFQGPRGGISLLPYSSADVELSMLVALAAPTVVDAAPLADYVRSAGTTRTATRARSIVALAALAALGEPVVEELRAASRQPGLTVEESLHVAIGLAEAGDHETATRIEQELLAESGQQLGAWIRLSSGQPSQSSELTSLLSILAATIGDDAVATAADAYVAEDPPRETIASLQRIAYTTRSLDRADAAAGRFAYSLGGERTVVDLEPGSSSSLALTADQRASLSLEPLSGQLVVTSSWSEPLGAKDLAGQDPSIGLARSRRPAGSVADDATVQVRIDVTLGETANAGCYLVTDHVPAGLAPVRSTSRRAGGEVGDLIAPWDIEGQRVTFCVYRDEEDPVQELGYAARVVTPGAYAWEPTLVQSVRAPQSWRLGVGDLIATE